MFFDRRIAPPPNTRTNPNSNVRGHAGPRAWPRGLGAALLTFLLVLPLAACSDDGFPIGVVPEPPAPATLQVEPGELAFAAVGDAATLDVTVLNADGEVMAGVEVTFTSANPAVAVVDGTGLVTAVGVGQTTLDLVVGELSREVPVTVGAGEPTGG